MQRLTAKTLNLAAQRVAETGAAHAAGAVDRVADHRVAQVLHVHPDLMSTPGFQLYRKVGVMREALGHPVVGNRGPPIADHRHAGATGGMATDGCIDRAAPGGAAMDDGVVFALDRARLQRAHQMGVTGQIERHHQQAAGVLVQAMDDARSGHLRQRRVTMQQSILHGRIRLAGTGVHGQPGWLVDDGDVLVLVQKLQFDGLCLHVIGHRQTCIDPQDVARMNRIAGAARRLPIDGQFAAVDPGFQALAGIVIEQLRCGAVQATAVQLRRHLAVRLNRYTLLIIRFQKILSLMSQRLLAVLCLATPILITGCASDPNALAAENPFRSTKTERELRYEADELYRSARRKLDGADFQGAILDYVSLRARYPFSEYATQAQMELIYAHYRNFQPDLALTEADRFLRDHPRHPQTAYVHYLKGMIYFQRGQGFLDNFEFVDASKQDVTDARRAFDAFTLLVQRFPDSDYVGDAQLRMRYLRNRIAEHEMHVVRYYVKRGAHVAAARRAEQIIATYPGAPAAFEALELAATSYRALGLEQQAAEAEKLVAQNRAAVTAALKQPAAAPEKDESKGWFSAMVDWLRGDDLVDE